MTFLEKAKKEHRISNENHTIQDLCPSDLGYEQKVKCKAIIGADAKDKAYICRRCWEREMPGTEPKVDAAFTDDLLNQGYNKGLADAWKLFKQVLEMPNDVFCEHILEGDAFNPPLAMVNCLTPHEAIAKLKEYEDRKIEVGDVVVLDDEEYVVTRVNKTPPTITISGLNAKGEAICWSDNDYTKTGKHIDIQEILKQIGE